MEIIAAIAALCIGILIGMCLFQDRPVGDLRVDHSDFADEGPHLYLELDTDIRAVMRKKRAPNTCWRCRRTSMCLRPSAPAS